MWRWMGHGDGLWGALQRPLLTRPFEIVVPVAAELPHHGAPSLAIKSNICFLDLAMLVRCWCVACLLSSHIFGHVALVGLQLLP